MEITTENVSIDVGDTTMGGYLARPAEGGDRPAVIVWMEIFGINSHIRDVTERVAAEGYVALAPDFFHRTLPGVELGYDDEGMAEGMKGLGALDAVLNYQRRLKNLHLATMADLSELSTPTTE